MNELLMGIDIGYGYVKSENISFASGIKELPSEPPLKTKILRVGRKYYSLGNAKNDIQESKYDDEDTRLCTEAAIAEELKLIGKRKADIRLGVGLPLTRMGAEKKSYIEYMNQSPELKFNYEGIPYNVKLVSVDVFPQGYSAVADRLESFNNSTVVIDIGSWTVDILPIIEGRPDMTRCKSLPQGIITCINDINEALRQKLGGDADDVIIKEVMIKGTANIDSRYLKIIQDNLKAYVEDIMSVLRSFRFNKDLTTFVFVGGGASIIKNFLDDKKNVEIIDDININAKGYKKLIECKYGG